jgi:hypothetical protein
VSPLGLYGALALICVTSSAVGWATLVATGRRQWSWLAPGIGLAALIVLASVALALPGRGVTASVAVAMAVAAALAFLWLRRPEPRHALGAGVPVIFAVVLVASIPFAVGGGFEVMGTYVNNDLAFHVDNARWLRSPEGIEPGHITSGYPTGPHALVVAVSGLTGTGLPTVFTALLMAIPVMTALASLSLLESARPSLRTLAAVLVGLPYLGASFYVQSAFKETIVALFALCFVLAVREAVREPVAARTTRRTWLGAALAPGLLCAGSVASYSMPGLAWAGGTVAIWVVLALALGEPGARRLILARPRRVLLIAAGAAIVALGALAGWSSAVSLSGGALGGEALGNLFEPIPADQVMGIWLSSDYRVLHPGVFPTGPLLTKLLAGLGLAALAFGVVHLARRRELVLLAAMAATVLIYLGGRYLLSPYVGSKALAVMAPLVMLFAFAGLLLWPSERNRVLDIARVGLLVAFSALALLSTYLALAGARLDNDDHASELAEFRPEVDGERVLFVGTDEYAPYDLEGAAVTYPVPIPPGLRAPGEERNGLPRTGERTDFDTLTSRALDQVDYAITTKSSYASEPPENFQRVDSTDSFVLWQRVGPTPPRQTLPEGDLIGKTLNCDRSAGRRISSLDGRARVLTREPVLVEFGRLPGEESEEAIDPIWVYEGHPLTQSARLPAGRWELSIQYHSLEPLVLGAPGLIDRVLPPNSTRIGPYWPLGSVEIEEERTIDFTVGPRARPALRALIGVPEGFRTGPQSIVGILAAMPAGDARETVPLSQACGRFVDWYERDGAPSSE